MLDDCRHIQCESCENRRTRFMLRGACDVCGHALCPRVIPHRLGGIA